MKKFVGLIGLILLLALVAGGCSGSGEDSSPTQTLATVNDDDSDDDSAIPDDDDDAVDDDDTSDDDDTIDDDDDTPPDECVEPIHGYEVYEDTRFCPGGYFIDGDGPAIVIKTDNVSIWGEGVTLTYSGKGTSTGISTEESRIGLSIHGFRIERFSRGVHLSGEGIKVEGTEIDHPGNTPLYATGSRIEITGITASDSETTGVTLQNCTDCSVTYSLLTNEIEGVIESNVIIDGGGDNIIEGNTIHTRNESGCNAVWLIDTSGNEIRNNTFDLGFKDGSHFQGEVHDNLFVGNEYYMRLGQYIVWTIAESSNNQFYDNVFHDGVFLDESESSLFCVDGTGNEYLDGAVYRGDDENEGTCP